MLTEISDILAKMELEEDTQLIWGGDFNSFFDCKLDADGGNPKLKIQSITKLVSIMSENDLCGIFRVLQSRNETLHLVLKDTLQAA